MNAPIRVLIISLLFSTAALAQTQRPPAPSSTSAPAVRPRLADSATGYIDNAIIGSQVRIRVDSGSDVNAPDRAEFFYAKCGCYRFAPPPAFDPNAPGPGGPGQIESDLNFKELRMEGEYVIYDRLSVLADVPVRWIRPQTVDNAGGLGDIRVGFKGGVIATEDVALTGQLRAYIPSGDARRGLGTDHTSIEPMLLYHQRIGDEGFAIAGQTGLWIPINGSAGVPTSSSEKFSGNVFSYGFGGSYGLVDTAQFRISPVVELVGWRVLDGFQTLSTGPEKANGTNIVNLKIGARVDIGGPSSIYVGFGHALTDAVWYDNIVRLEYRVAF